MSRSLHDIKAPDGYLLGGLRRVRRDGTILFQRGWWEVAKEWAGEEVWVHCLSDDFFWIEVAPPGYRLWEIGSRERNVFAPHTDRRDAKPAVRNASVKAWFARNNTGTTLPKGPQS